MRKLRAVKCICFILMFSLIFIGCSKDVSWHYEKLNIKKSLKISTGTNQVIAFIDTGLARELCKTYSNRIISPYNVVNNNDDIIDKHGHGTEMVSVACSSGEQGISGIAPNAKIMPIVAIDKSGLTTPENLAKAIKWAIDHNATVINLSLGSKNSNEVVKKNIELALKKNIIVVASAGDYSNADILFPASLQDVISVTAQGEDGKILELSNYSKNKDSILAPGDSIPVISIDEKGNIIKKISTGTSVSTSIVSALIALSLELNPEISPQTIQVYLQKSINSHEFIDSYKFLKYIKELNVSSEKVISFMYYMDIFSWYIKA